MEAAEAPLPEMDRADIGAGGNNGSIGGGMVEEDATSGDS